MFGLNCGHVDVDVILYGFNVLSDVHLGAVDEEVYVDEVVCTACAELNEVLEVRQACLTSTVGDGRGAELDGAEVGLHEPLVDGDTLGWCEISL